MDNSVETVNAAAAAFVTIENRVQQINSPRRRRGGWLCMYWCFGAQGHGKRINHATVIPEAILAGSQLTGPENITHSPSTPPFVAPPSSPVSFLQSEPPSAIHSPVALSENAFYLDGSNSIFAIGPYAYETQLVSPPAFTATEPSTASFTPPHESVNTTTPPSPEVPFAELLMSSFDLNIKRSDYNEFQSYQMYPGSPIGNLVSPSSKCSGTSSPFPDPELYLSISNNFPSFPLDEPPELLNAEDLAMRKRMRRQPSLKDGFLSSNQSMESDSFGDISDCRILKPQIKHWMPFELTEEEVAYRLGNGSIFPDRSESESESESHDAANINKDSPRQIHKADTETSCCVDEPSVGSEWWELDLLPSKQTCIS